MTALLYVIGVVVLALSLGERLKVVREAQEELARRQRQTLGVRP